MSVDMPRDIYAGACLACHVHWPQQSSMTKFHPLLQKSPCAAAARSADALCSTNCKCSLSHALQWPSLSPCLALHWHPHTAVARQLHVPSTSPQTCIPWCGLSTHQIETCQSCTLPDAEPSPFVVSGISGAHCKTHIAPRLLASSRPRHPAHLLAIPS